MGSRFARLWRVSAAAVVFAGTAWATGVVEYDISATLVPKERAVVGRERLTWHNPSSVEVRELQFHLYMNAFRNDKSTFARESHGGLKRLKEGGWGRIDIQRLAIAGGADLSKAIRFIHPDDDNAEDRTAIAVALPAPVKAGGTIALDIDFYTRLPHVVARTGYHGDFYMVGQWFPKIGVWQNGGWNCHQFHALSEFYADFGSYTVDLKAPSGYLVGATGVRQGATNRFVQDNVHDFAWTAFPRYVRVARQRGPLEMILLMQPEHASQIERHFKALETAIEYFGRWYGPYPYRTITVVDPPYGAGEAGGMEYPTLITAGTSWLVSRHSLTPEDVIVHEFGHQYWYGMVGSNEFEEPWLDEGFTQYSTGKILDLAYGRFTFGFRLAGVPVGAELGLPTAGHDELNRAAYLLAPKADSLARNSWQYYDEYSYGINAYARPAITLRTLENYLGADTMARILRTYFERWRFRHPTTSDFIAVVNEVSGRDMRWFFDQFFYGSNVLDYAVGEITDERVTVRRLGEAVFPVEVRVRFENGTTADRTWDGKDRWREFRFKRRVESVEIDPSHKVLLDADFANNSRTRAAQPRAPAKWAENLLFWAENALLGLLW